MGKSRNIPNRLRRHRILAGFKQKEVAKILGLRCTNRLSRWEKGLSMPSLLNALKLAALYGTLLEELYADTYKPLRIKLKHIKR